MFLSEKIKSNWDVVVNFNRPAISTKALFDGSNQGFKTNPISTIAYIDNSDTNQLR